MAASARSKQIHPLLPNKYSDHLPILAEMPMGGKMIQMVTWNLDKAKEQDSQVETKSEGGSEITDALAKMIDEQKSLDLILLQNCTLELLDKLNKSLKSDWSLVVGANQSLITLYNVERLTLTKQTDNPDFSARDLEGLTHFSQSDIKHRTQQTEVRLKESKESFFVYNACWQESDTTSTANRSLTFLHRKKCIVAGSFGQCVVQPDKKYLINSLSVKNGKLFASFTDGVFFTGEDEKIHQPKIICTLNPSNGKKFVFIKAPILQDISSEFQSELEMRRQFITVAEEHSAESKINEQFGAPTLDFLRGNGIVLQFNQNTDVFNQPKVRNISIILNKLNKLHTELFSYLVENLKPVIDSNIHDGEIRISTAKLKDAILAIQSFYEDKRLSNKIELFDAFQKVKMVQLKVNLEIAKLNKKLSKNINIIAKKDKIKEFLLVLNNLIETWREVGSAMTDLPFTTQFQFLQMPKLGFFEKLGKVVTEKDMIELKAALQIIEKKLVYIPYAQLLDKSPAVTEVEEDKHVFKLKA